MVAPQVAPAKPASNAADISARAKRALVPVFSYMEAVFKSKGPEGYDPVSKPDGYICLAVAENVLNFDMLKDKLASCRSISKEVITYPGGNGFGGFPAACAKFMSRHMIHSHTVEPTRLTLSAGCGAVLDNIFWALCDPGDAVIIPAPCYPAFRNDLVVRDECHVVYTKVHPEYRLTEDLLQEAYDRALTEAKRVRGLLLCNPNNPIGLIYTRSELEMAARWAEERDIHIISDEIYAHSVFQGSQQFVSMADVADMGRGLVHIIWGFSKVCGVQHAAC
eukprot:comp24047_c0_seq1/m.43135 comp24047_c0_seq1/g.43135  ORF comp24047_c0_seq1/g.43135 comp24047_c0_seq1/m.43135 type:complete len:278 (-) comp24047_c0_seq1:942-1775(-)